MAAVSNSAQESKRAKASHTEKYAPTVVPVVKAMESDQDEKVSAMAKLTEQRIASTSSDFTGTYVPP